MRTIKFRGICNEENTNYYGKWIHGYLGYENSINPVETVGDDEIEDYGIYDELTFINVRPETVGQFTGLHDKNGVEIYEGDIIRKLGLKKTWTLSRRDEFSNRNYIVMWNEEELQWCGNLYEQSVLEIYEMDTRPLEFLCKNYTIEVIGNIHEEVEE